MNNKNENRHMIDVLFVLTLFFVFALSTLTLVILGANVYRSTVNHMSENFTDRTSYAYITQKLRQEDESGSISIGDIEGIPACIMTNEVNGAIYNTYLYEYDGYLYELLARADLHMKATDGTPILPLEKFNIDKANDNLFKITINTENSEDFSMYISSHTEGGFENE